MPSGPVVHHIDDHCAVRSVKGLKPEVDTLTHTQFVIARSEATWRSRSRSDVLYLDEIATLRSQ